MAGSEDHRRAIRLHTLVRRLEQRLSQLLGEQTWRESGLGAPDDVDELKQRIVHLEQPTVDLHIQLDDQVKGATSVSGLRAGKTSGVCVQGGDVRPAVDRADGEAHRSVSSVWVTPTADHQAPRLEDRRPYAKIGPAGWRPGAAACPEATAGWRSHVAGDRTLPDVTGYGRPSW